MLLSITYWSANQVINWTPTTAAVSLWGGLEGCAHDVTAWGRKSSKSKKLSWVLKVLSRLRVAGECGMRCAGSRMLTISSNSSIGGTYNFFSITFSKMFHYVIFTANRIQNSWHLWIIFRIFLALYWSYTDILFVQILLECGMYDAIARSKEGYVPDYFFWPSSNFLEPSLVAWQLKWFGTKVS